MERSLSADNRVHGMWLAGSLGCGRGDAFSDVDLIVTVHAPVPADLRTDPFAALRLPGTVLYTRRKPRNAPAGGGYLAVCLELAGLPVLVDLYVWPVTNATLPVGATVLFQHGETPRSPVGLIETLAQQPANEPAGADPDDPTNQLYLIQLAAKYHARADHLRFADMCRRLKISADENTDALRQVLAGRVPPANNAAVRAVGQLLDLAEANRRPRSEFPP
ncbi:hypothetical protein BJY16_001823 [Actinoplanes octamycinicus]|uniref:Nucleotidyltransferase-like protein n=1 Tax=Actinoplanes octamycinicus TaxID=135948 RepID=A0A7W7M618_9ACTN|nr:hypothetical protein [Actinoplanes octamycinicus]MBB4738364.1 hypothetical protein [Actinoplanes octamycinicus]